MRFVILSDSWLHTVIDCFVFLCRDDLVNITLQFPNIEKKTSWEAAFTAAKQKLGNYKNRYV